LDEDSCMIKNAFHGAQTLNELLIVPFGMESEEIVSAKLGLLATSEDIYSSFVRICKAAFINVHEFIVFAFKVLPHLRQIMTLYMSMWKTEHVTNSLGGTSLQD